MKISQPKPLTKYGSGVLIELDDHDLATAIEAFLAFKGVYIRGARTITVNGELCENAEVFIDPSGEVTHNKRSKSKHYSGRGKKHNEF